VIANTLWAAVNAGLGAAVLRHAFSVQRRRRADYRFPVPLPAEVDFGGVRARGTVDDLSPHGLRYYGPLPAGIEPDREFAVRLTLPDGPLKVRGRLRSLIPLDGHPGVHKGFGGALTASTNDQQRIERFLFGSDMQWLVNGYSDQTETPLSRLLAATVTGPSRSPFLQVHWNSAEVTEADDRSFQALLSYSGTGSEVWLLSFTPLPENELLRLECFRRDQVAPQIVRLQRADAQHQLGPPTFVYRVLGVERQTVEQWDREQQREVA